MSGQIITQDQPVPASRIGMADIVAFGNNGVTILRNNIRTATKLVINDFGYDAGGWHTDKHVRLVADTTGNGHADIIGFADAGVKIAINNGNNSFSAPLLVLKDFGYDAGQWRVDKHIRYMVDVRGTGRADIIGFGDKGVLISRNNGNGNFSLPTLALNDLGYNQGWRMDKHLRFMGDCTGNGLPDIIGFGEHHVFISINNGDGTFQAVRPVIQSFTYSSGGWRIHQHPRMIADLTGDGCVDIIGFADNGTWIALNNGNGTFQPPKNVLTSFGQTSGGWSVEHHPRFVADTTGDGCGDIIGFANGGVFIAVNNGNGTFQEPKLVLNDFGYRTGGWKVDKHLRFPVDLTGDGRVDIIGFGDNAVWVSYNDGNGNFGPVQKLVDDFTFGQGWTRERTVRYVTNLSRQNMVASGRGVRPGAPGLRVSGTIDLNLTLHSLSGDNTPLSQDSLSRTVRLGF